MCNNNKESTFIKVISNDMFINLHNHSSFSLLDGMSKPDDMVSRAKKLHQTALAITEHGNLFSSVKVYKECQKQSIKYIHGCELYVSPNSRFDKDKNSKYYHMTVLAKNEKGRLNLNKLVTLGYLEGFYYKPRVDFELLKQYGEGLVVLSGCMAGELQQALSNGDIDSLEHLDITESGITKAKGIIKKYVEVFGDDYYLEVQSHRDSKQRKLNRVIIDLANEMGVKYVATADSHYTEEDDFELHSIFIQIGTNREAGETYQDAFLQSEEDVMRILQPTLTEEEAKQSVLETRHIADKCNVHIPLSAPIIPHVEIPFEFDTEEDYLKDLCNKGWVMRGIGKQSKDKVKEYQERLMYEYNAITEMGFTGYYLLVYSYANSVKRRGIARGSGGGSLVAYLLNIVDIDPIKYGLYFERFIDVGALDLLKSGVITEKELKIPDFDLDFGTNDREKVVKFIEDTYTQEKFASLGQFGYIWDKSAVKDVGRVLGIDFNITNQITKDLNDLSIDDARHEGYIAKWEKQYPKLFEYAEKIAGTPRSFGKHPCGRCITVDDTLSYHALADNDGELVFQMDMDDAEELGLVKIDALGLRTIDVIYDTLDMIHKDYEYINPSKMNMVDPKVLEVFQNGFTDGVFQFESSGMKETLKKMKPTGLDDLGVANALYRPGAMKYIDVYINRKHGLETVEYLHEDLKKILSVTYGIIVFQEQLIEVGRLAKMRNPDKLRKATGKKDLKLMEECRAELVEGLVEGRGWTNEQFEQLWTDMLDFARYSFNKSHSYAYAIIAYTCAFLKTYHPAEFMTALFNSFEGKHDRMEGCFKEAKRLGVNINPLSFRSPSPICTLENGSITYGLTLIKYCNKQMAEELDKISYKDYNYFTDLLIDITEGMTINSRQMNVLINLDFFKEFGTKEMIADLYDNFKNGKGIKYDKKYVEKTKLKRVDLLHEFEEECRKKEYEPTPMFEHIMIEQEHYGFIKSVYPDYDPNMFAIINIDKKYTPKVFLYNFKTGQQMMFKIKKKKFYNINNMDNLFIGDIIRVNKTSEEGKWKKEGEEWIQMESVKEPFIENVDLISRTYEDGFVK